jgi:cytochrome c-type biogenesis protein CcmH
VFGVAGYWLQGSWRDAAVIQLARDNPAAAQVKSIHSMVEGLEKKLLEQPDDAEGWAMLGRSKVVLEDYAAAAQAYAKANELAQSEPQPEWLVGEGEALALARDHDLAGRPAQLFDQALALQPDDARALWYAGLAAGQARDYATARKHWLKLREQELPAELRQVVEERLAVIAQETGEPVPALAPKAAAPSAVTLKVKVRVDPSVAGRQRPGQVLFVFAKAVSGPPMPLAVQRIPDPALPLEVTLDDGMAMMPQLKLSQFAEWQLGARLSSSGEVKGAPGDLEGSLHVVREQAGAPVELVIDHVIP